MNLLLPVPLIVLSALNFVFAEREAERYRTALDGKPVPRAMRLVMGSPPSATHIRKAGTISFVLFALPLIVNLATG